MPDGTAWDAGTWEGARKEQLRRSLALSVRERLDALGEMAETSDRLAEAARRSPDSASDRPALRLDGCAPTPLADYLKALGVLRLVSEQADSGALGWWAGDAFHLRCSLDRADLVAFLRDDYRPTPILAPWNGGSGFYRGHYKSAIKILEMIEAGSAQRLGLLRRVIGQAHDIIAREGLKKQPKKGGPKELLFARLRAELPDEALDFLDAAVVLTEAEAHHPPLLGTGANDGNLDFTVNFLRSLTELFDPGSGEPEIMTESLLREALFRQPMPFSGAGAIGQFSPVAAGGPNATSSFEGSARVNPWDYVLMLEGSVLFAAAATRRLEASGGGAASFPFTVKSSGAGSGAASLTDEASARGEIWMPLWSNPATLGEVEGLLREGRATVRRRAARDGLDFARAVATLGVARGVREFQRYGFLQRYGRTYLATPLNRIAVRHNPTAALIDQLERRGWLARFRRFARGKEAPARLGSLARRLDDALFDVALRGSPRAVQETLMALGEVMRYLAISPAARDRCRPPPLLEENWVGEADDGSREFDLAVALASLHMRAAGATIAEALPMVVHLAPVAGGQRQQWLENEPGDVVWGPRPLEENLRLVLGRRLLVAQREQLPERPLAAWATASLSDVTDWLTDDLDTARIQALLQGLVLARIPRRIRAMGKDLVPAVPGAYRVLKPFFCTERQLRRIGFLGEDETLPLPSEILRHLGASRVGSAAEIGGEALRVRGFPVPPHLRPTYPDGPRLLAALMVPLPHGDLSRVLSPLRRPVHHPPHPSDTENHDAN